MLVCLVDVLQLAVQINSYCPPPSVVACVGTKLKMTNFPGFELMQKQFLVQASVFINVSMQSF